MKSRYDNGRDIDELKMKIENLLVKYNSSIVYCLEEEQIQLVDNDSFEYVDIDEQYYYKYSDE